MGLTINAGCLSLSGGCLTLGACNQNSNSCDPACCQWLKASLISRLSSGASWSDDGTYYTTDMDNAFTNNTGDRQCPGSEITLDANNFWQWSPLYDSGTNIIASGTLTATTANLECPPLDHNGLGWAWHNDAGGGLPDPTLRLMTMDCVTSEALALPDTGSTLMVVGIISDFTTSASTTVSPLNPVWTGTLVWSVADAQWESNNADVLGFNSIQQADGRYLNGQTIVMFATYGLWGVLNLEIGDVGFFVRTGGHWYDPIGVGGNNRTRKGRMYVTLGVAP